MVTYNNNIPQGGQSIASTQVPILTNFQSIDTTFNGQTGNGSGGGNFTTYNLQDTTTNFVNKPTNPIGTFYSLPSSAGNPELGWINNVNAIGAGPYTGTRITGGGITSAAWITFAPNSALPYTPVANTSYNITSVTSAGGNNLQINFTRNFVNNTYCVIAYSEIFNSATVFSKSTSNCVITTLLSASNLNVIIFGFLV